VLALREPPSEDEVVALLRAFFDAWQHESLESLLAFSTADAGELEGTDHGHAALVENWRQRLRAHDYARISGAEIVRAERVERWEWDDLGTAPNPPRPAAMRPGDLYVRAPVEVPHIAGERVFGDSVTMVLRRQEGKLHIAAYGEADSP
jgi:hypothetical protein